MSGVHVSAWGFKRKDCDMFMRKVQSSATLEMSQDRTSHLVKVAFFRCYVLPPSNGNFCHL